MYSSVINVSPQDRLAGRRSPVVVIMLVLGIAALFVYEGII